jgi:alpha-tubulin suppressor-like RCC1 family protein
MSKQKPVFISAGDSHSAAISEKLKLYTWGNGSFGRLGHGLDTNEKKPKMVEDLDQYETTYVSCGAFHTLVQTADYQTFAFG